MRLASFSSLLLLGLPAVAAAQEQEAPRHPVDVAPSAPTASAPVLDAGRHPVTPVAPSEAAQPTTTPAAAPTTSAAAPTTSAAPPPIAVGALESAPAVRSVRGDIGSKVGERFVMPAGYTEVGGELAFITSDAVVTRDKLGFGDLALFRPGVRRSVGDRVELSLGTVLLPKQPTGGHDWIWQGASLGAVLEPWDGYALTLGGQAGPLLGGRGSVWSAAPGVAAKWSIDRDARVLLSLANDFTALDGSGHLGTRSWLDEVALGGEVQFGHREAAAWVGVDYAVPVAKHGNQPLSPTPLALRPAVRLDLQVGGVVRLGDNDDWDFFAYYAWIDRGAAGHPATLLPILDGGFDQRQIVIGVHHRFGHHRSDAYEYD